MNNEIDNKLSRLRIPIKEIDEITENKILNKFSNSEYYQLYKMFYEKISKILLNQLELFWLAIPKSEKGEKYSKEKKLQFNNGVFANMKFNMFFELNYYELIFRKGSNEEKKELKESLQKFIKGKSHLLTLRISSILAPFFIFLEAEQISINEINELYGKIIEIYKSENIFKNTYKSTKENFLKRLNSAIQDVGKNKTKIAKKLSISRTTLYNRLSEYDINFKDL